MLELIIALALSLVLSNVLVEIYLQSKKVYYLVQRLDNIENNVQIVFQWMSHDIRLAGLIGCMRLRDYSPLNADLTSENALFVWKNEYVIPLKSFFPNLSRAKSFSDIILVQFLDSTIFPVKFAEGQTIFLNRKVPFRLYDECLISDCQHAEAFQWGKAMLYHTYQYNAEVGFLNKIIYYIGDTGKKNSKGNTVYALYRRNLNRSSHNSTALVEGIEKLSIRLGVMDPTSRRLTYVLPAQVKKWFSVRTVEIKLTLMDKKYFEGQWVCVIALRERTN